MGNLTIGAGERVTEVHFTENEICVTLMDGRTISAALAWHPRLLHATAKQRKNWQTCGADYGIHWSDTDEDLSTEGLLPGARAPLPRTVKT
jgi:hypothetical protein